MKRKIYFPNIFTRMFSVLVSGWQTLDEMVFFFFFLTVFLKMSAVKVCYFGMSVFCVELES